jgi:hypothetical protein
MNQTKLIKKNKNIRFIIFFNYISFLLNKAIHYDLAANKLCDLNNIL